MPPPVKIRVLFRDEARDPRRRSRHEINAEDAARILFRLSSVADVPVPMEARRSAQWCGVETMIHHRLADPIDSRRLVSLLEAIPGCESPLLPRRNQYISDSMPCQGP